MKIIDLLNKIAKGEEVPLVIKCEDVEFALEDEDITEIPDYEIETSMSIGEGMCAEKINALIRNQQKIIEVLNNNNKDSR